jgi:hypothetical protein
MTPNRPAWWSANASIGSGVQRPPRRTDRGPPVEVVDQRIVFAPPRQPQLRARLHRRVDERDRGVVEPGPVFPINSPAMIRSRQPPSPLLASATRPA